MVVCGLGIAFAGSLRFQPANAGEKGGQLKDWEFPDAESHRSVRFPQEKVLAGDYATSKPFKEVWTYYAKKIGYKKDYEPNLACSGGDGQNEFVILNSTNDPAVAKARRPSATSATLIRRGPGGNVTVFISRAKDEDKTYFTLIVEKK
jgi:hypothetical protein